MKAEGGRRKSEVGKAAPGGAKPNYHAQRRFCDCGQPATEMSGSVRVCARCHAIEQRSRQFKERRAGEHALKEK